MVNGGLGAHPSSGVVPTVLPDSIAGLAEQRKEEATAVTVAQVTNLSCADKLSSTPLCSCRCVSRRNVRSDANMSVKVSTQRGFDEFSDPGSGAMLSD